MSYLYFSRKALKLFHLKILNIIAKTLFGCLIRKKLYHAYTQIISKVYACKTIYIYINILDFDVFSILFRNELKFLVLLIRFKFYNLYI